MAKCLKEVWDVLDPLNSYFGMYAYIFPDLHLDSLILQTDENTNHGTLILLSFMMVSLSPYDLMYLNLMGNLILLISIKDYDKPLVRAKT